MLFFSVILVMYNESTESIVPADMSEAYEKKFKKRFIISASLLGIIVIGLIAMLFMTFVL